MELPPALLSDSGSWPALQDERLRQILDALPAAVYTTDAQGRITYWNPACVEFSGRVPELGSDHWCVTWKLYRPDGTPLPHDQCPMAVALEEQRTVRGEEVIAERPDGTRIWFEPHPTPLFDDAGTLIGGVNMLVDISKRKQVEHAGALLAAIVESSDDAIITKDLNGVITSWNKSAERLFGYAAHEVIGRPVTILIPPDRLDEETAILDRLRRGQRLDHFETVRVCKDGTKLDISLTISPVLGDAGRIIAISKIARDITEQKRAQEALREQDRRKDEFLAMLAHELRSPLAPIHNAVQLLLRSGGGDGKTIASATEVLQRQVGHIVRLVDDLLDVNRISRGRIQLRKAWTNLATIVTLAVESARAACEGMGHDLTVTVPARPIWLDADPSRLAQVLGNLLNNACKFTDRGGRVGLAIEQEGQQAVILVRDSGIGIAADQLPHVFDMFMQVDTPLARSRGGLGLGLTLVKRLVELHGGTVEARSAGIGHGSEFVVRLPVAESVPPTPPTDVQPVVAARRRILIVDDNRDSADSLAMLMKLAGHDVHTAHDGLEAVDKAAALQPGLILLDIGLPGINGYEAARRIRRNQQQPALTLVALTGWSREEDRRRSAEAGFDAHLAKPVDLDELTRLLANAAPC